MMRLTLVGVVVSASSLLLPGTASAQYGLQRTEKLPGGTCLSDEQRKVNADLKALKRPTTKEDPVWIFDPDYFIGTWNLDWNGPETPLGSDIGGTLTIVHIEGCDYEGSLRGTSAEGPFTAKIQIFADPSRGWFTWVETDSRGFTLLRSGMIGGDLGGYFTHFWDRSPMVTVQGKKVRLVGNTFMASPGAFQLRSQVSVDGGPYMSMGILWFRKEFGASAPGAGRP